MAAVVFQVVAEALASGCKLVALVCQVVAIIYLWVDGVMISSS